MPGRATWRQSLSRTSRSSRRCCASSRRNTTSFSAVSSVASRPPPRTPFSRSCAPTSAVRSRTPRSVSSTPPWSPATTRSGRSGPGGCARRRRGASAGPAVARPVAAPRPEPRHPAHTAANPGEYLSSDPLHEPRHLEQFFETYRRLREESGESTAKLRVESFQKALAEKVEKIKREQGCEAVLIRVTSEQGRTRIVAKPFRRQAKPAGRIAVTMRLRSQRTLAQPAACCGIGLHSGLIVNLELQAPAAVERDRLPARRPARETVGRRRGAQRHEHGVRDHHRVPGRAHRHRRASARGAGRPRRRQRPGPGRRRRGADHGRQRAALSRPGAQRRHRRAGGGAAAPAHPARRRDRRGRARRGLLPGRRRWT